MMKYLIALLLLSGCAHPKSKGNWIVLSSDEGLPLAAFNAEEDRVIFYSDKVEAFKSAISAAINLSQPKVTAPKKK